MAKALAHSHALRDDCAQTWCAPDWAVSGYPRTESTDGPHDTTVACHPVTRITTDRRVRITPDVWAQECRTCGDVPTAADIGALASAMARHVTRSHGRTT